MRNRNNSDADGSGSGKIGKKQAEKKKDSIDGPTPGKCLNCGKKGHWAKDCWSKLKKGKAHVAQTVEEEESSLFQATVGDFFTNTSAPKQGGNGENSNGGGVAPGEDQQPMVIREYLWLGIDGASDQKRVELSEEHVFTQISANGEHRDHRWWILDTGATDHMTGARKAFSELGFGIRGSVKFGDGFIIEIEGRGTILFVGKGSEHQRLTGVYSIPCLKANMPHLHRAWISKNL
jgi:hypothetical protein